jgi:hypothetical protein
MKAKHAMPVQWWEAALPFTFFKVSFLFVWLVSIQGLAHIDNLMLPAMALWRRLSCFMSHARVRFASARAFKLMIPTWGQSYLGFRALIDEPLRDAHQQQSLAPCSGASNWLAQPVLISSSGTMTARFCWVTAWLPNLTVASAHRAGTAYRPEVVITHIGCSIICQSGGKGVQAVKM